MKRLSQETEISNLMNIEWFKVEYQPSTRHIKDKQVRKNTMNTRLSHIVHADLLKQAIADLKKERLRYIKATPITIDLPKICPECQKVGSPIITETERTKSGILDFNGNLRETLKTERWLRYNHRDRKHHRIGKYKIITIIPKDKRRTIKQIPCIQLKKSLDSDCLRKKFTHYLSGGNVYPLK